MSQRPTIAAFLDPAHEPLIGELAEVAGCDVISAGTWSRGQSGAIAAALANRNANQRPCIVQDDLRSMLATSQADVLLIADSGDFGSQVEDVRALLAAKSRSSRIVSLGVIPRTIDELWGVWRMGQASGGEGASAGMDQSIRMLGLPRRSQAVRDATEILTAFGEVRSLSIRSFQPTAGLSLAATLIGSLDLFVALMGGIEDDEPAWIDATLAPRGNAPAPGQARLTTLSQVRGELHMLIRCGSTPRAASICISDSASAAQWSAVLHSSQGRLDISECGFTWRAPDGEVHDHHAVEPASLGALLGRELRDLMDASTPDPGPINAAQLLTLAHTAILSASTAQPESPAMVAKMLRGVM